MAGYLFAYGTLQVPEVIEAVCGRGFAGEPARLSGYLCRRMRDAGYPGIRPEPGALTVGLLYSGVDQAAFAQLDRFEGEQYERRQVQVETAAGRPVMAAAYVVSPEHLVDLSGDAWDLDSFREHDLAAFRREYRGWRS